MLKLETVGGDTMLREISCHFASTVGCKEACKAIRAPRAIVWKRSTAVDLPSWTGSGELVLSFLPSSSRAATPFQRLQAPSFRLHLQTA